MIKVMITVPIKNPKEKGNNFERKIAKKLSDWSGVKFMRTPMSGAIHNFKDKRVVSDIVPPLSIGNFPFSIECKNVNCSWEFSGIIDGTSITLEKHWDQCVKDAEQESLLPLLIFTKNYRQVYSVLEKEVFDKFNLKMTSWIEVYSERYKKPLVIFDFDEFLSKTSLQNLQSTCI